MKCRNRAGFAGTRIAMTGLALAGLAFAVLSMNRDSESPAEATPEGAIFCVETSYASFCFAPGTDPAYVEEVIRRLPQPEMLSKNQFEIGARWSSTATDPTTGGSGDPVTLTWGLLPDGVSIPGTTAGDPTAPSDLQAVFDLRFPSPTVWRDKIRQSFSRWEGRIGATYVEVTYDDGAAFPGAFGSLGVRPDIRIGGHPIDGVGGVLAYNYFPIGGDMVIDTQDWPLFDNTGNDYRFFRNTVMHEHGHGLGLAHVNSNTGVLMEPFIQTSFNGPQDDDIRGGQRNYGDIYENNDVVLDATDLDLLGAIASPGFSLTQLSIDRGPDLDWYAFDASAGGLLSVTVDPVGSAYTIGPDGGPTSSIVTDEITDLEFSIYAPDGTTELINVAAAGLGANEVLADFFVGAGTHYIVVRRTAGTGNACQRYDMTVSFDISTDVAAGEVPAAPLDLTVAPNPFNPTTTIRFRAPSATEYEIGVYETTGRLVRTLRGHAAAAGAVAVTWNGRDDAGRAVGSGVYLLRTQAGGRTETQRATLIR
ncbi:MAG: matrixin family metalloprotease [Gemmatimonadetes bacterium]|nr:matrixin family metalloprotease [Gemmatimonadota bacterium]